jgi:tetratricopeptide (TPR) repeat protein
MNKTKIIASLFFILSTLAGATLGQNRVTDSNQHANEAVAANERGVALVREGRHAEAIQKFERAIRLNPQLAAAYNNLGVSYNSLQRYEDAVKVLTTALRLSPNYADAYYKTTLTPITTLVLRFRSAENSAKQSKPMRMRFESNRRSFTRTSV